MVLSGCEEGEVSDEGFAGQCGVTPSYEYRLMDQDDVMASFREQGVIIVGSKRSLF
jgi:hypothetical protein